MPLATNGWPFGPMIWPPEIWKALVVVLIRLFSYNVDTVLPRVRTQFITSGYCLVLVPRRMLECSEVSVLFRNIPRAVVGSEMHTAWFSGMGTQFVAVWPVCGRRVIGLATGYPFQSRFRDFGLISRNVDLQVKTPGKTRHPAIPKTHSFVEFLVSLRVKISILVQPSIDCPHTQVFCFIVARMSAITGWLSRPQAFRPLQDSRSQNSSLQRRFALRLLRSCASGNGEYQSGNRRPAAAARKRSSLRPKHVRLLRSVAQGPQIAPPRRMTSRRSRTDARRAAAGACCAPSWLSMAQLIILLLPWLRMASARSALAVTTSLRNNEISLVSCAKTSL